MYYTTRVISCNDPSYNRKAGINTKLLKAKATKGKLKLKKGTDSVDITIW
ncbi:MAG: hypothetical protein Q3987_09230 [Oscillospiraceae bacterium]|nr:hypothetical protein [Oscillospiraceae bacterium]